MNVVTPIPHKKGRIEIIPLIDIMFFLLASFMMVSLSQVHMKGIKVNLPTGASGETQSKRDYISVSVDANGNQRGVAPISASADVTVKIVCSPFEQVNFIMR